MAVDPLSVAPSDLTPSDLTAQAEARAAGAFTLGGQYNRAKLAQEANLLNLDIGHQEVNALRQAKRKQVYSDIITGLGAVVGTIIVPGVGTAVGAELGSLAGSAITGQQPHEATRAIGPLAEAFSSRYQAAKIKSERDRLAEARRIAQEQP